MAEVPGAETGGWQSDNKLLQEESPAQHCGARVLPPPRLLPFSSHRKDKDALGQGHCPRADVGGSLPWAEPHDAPLPQRSQCCNGDPIPIPCALFLQSESI